MLLMLLVALAIVWLGGVLVMVGICMSAARADRGEGEPAARPSGARRPQLRLVT